MVYSINETVAQMGQISIEGNIIPNEWYAHLRNEKNKIQTNAALILADIVYWYRPIPIHEIKTSDLTGYGKKFKDDILQLDYKYFSTKFGFSEVQSRSALIFLEKKGLIFREFRDVNIGNYILTNVMYIRIYPEKISAITIQAENCSRSPINEPIEQSFLKTPESHNQSPKLLPQPQPKQKDWAAKFTDEQKVFLDYLLNIKPEIGNSIERDHATWWIKSYGIEKIKNALQVYLQRVDMAKNDSTVPMPQHIGKYIRKALNDGLLPSTRNEVSTHQEFVIPPCSQKSKQVVIKIEPGPKKNVNTYTEISMMSMNINEVNDSASVTYQKEEEPRKTQNKQIIKEKHQEKNPSQIITQTSSFHNHQKTPNRPSKKTTQEQNWKTNFTSEEKKFLAFLLSIIPATGDKIEEKHATWWIKHFGIEKIKIALQVYWQQLEKAKKDLKVPMPKNIGGYVREALNKGTQPCRETDRRNKAFAEEFKKQMNWNGLKIKEKYCRVEDIGKEWHYNLPEAIFIESLKRTFENYCSLTGRQSCVA